MSRRDRWTSADLEPLPENGKRYEIIDGELYVSRQPNWQHQMECGRIFALLDTWNLRSQRGYVAVAPGIIFDDDDDVAPDVVWVSADRLTQGIDTAGHLRIPPELVVEVLSPGTLNVRRDREAKRKLYADRGVDEYWIVDWRDRRIEVYRRAGGVLDLVATLTEQDTLTSPLLPGFAALVADVFAGLPPHRPN